MSPLLFSQNLRFLLLLASFCFLLLNPSDAHSHISSKSQRSPSLNKTSSNYNEKQPFQHSTATSYVKTTFKNENENQTNQDDTADDSQLSVEQTQENQEKIAQISKLLQQSRDLHRKLLKERRTNEKATFQFQKSLKKLSGLSTMRSHAQKSLRRIDEKLKEYRRQAPLYERTIEILNRQAGAAILEINRLKTSKYAVMYEKAQLQNHFRQRGLEAWVQNYVKDSINPLVAGAVVEGTADVVAPMLDGIETLAAVNEDIARKMANQLRESVPLVERPFYSGFVTYGVLLLPLVLVTSVLMKIKRSLTNLSAGHFVILGNFYFALLSGGCFIATLLGSVDVLLTFRHVNLGLFDLVMVIHGILYIVHILLHLLMARRVRQKALFIHTLLLILVGAHFSIHSYLYAMRNEDPHVSKSDYAIYTGLFAYILYNWIVRQIRMSADTPGMKLNNRAISTIERPVDAMVAVQSSASKPQYLPDERRRFPSGMSHVSSTNQKFEGKEASHGEQLIENLLFTPTIASVGAGPSNELTKPLISGLRAAIHTKPDDATHL